MVLTAKAAGQLIKTVVNNTGIIEAEIIEHVNLNSSRSAKETIHLALAFDGAAPASAPSSRTRSARRTSRCS